MSFITDKSLGFFVKTRGYFSKYFFGGKGLALMFHRVRPEKLMSVFEQNRKWEITPEHLENVIKFFQKKNFSIIRADEIYTYLKSGKKEPFVIFTFDDGYLDNIEYAYPVFRKYKVPFTIFITTSYVKGSHYPWEFLIEYTLLNNSSFSFKYLNKEFSFNNLSLKDRSQAFSQIYSIIKIKNNPKMLHDTLLSIFNELPNINYKTINIIDPNTIKSLATDEIINFDIHSENHYVFSQLSKEEQVSDIKNAGIYLFELTGKNSKTMAYPYGGPKDINADTIKAVQKTKLDLCFTTWPANITTDFNKFLIPRYTIEMKTDEQELNYLINGIRHFSYNGFKRINNYNINHHLNE
ncbi:MAG: polysaccharide deacetylase family protein [Bacteroidales bacterium]|nr:polysaccharide deacetylase family protein [Bacteroidales bacterium]